MPHQHTVVGNAAKLLREVTSSGVTRRATTDGIRRKARVKAKVILLNAGNLHQMS